MLIYGPDGTFKLERVTHYFTYLKEARSMVLWPPLGPMVAAAQLAVAGPQTSPHMLITTDIPRGLAG